MNQSYQNAPSCITAFSAAKIDLVTYKPVNPEVMTYLRDYQCLEHLISSKQNLIDAQYVQAMILFHDDHQPVEERLRILKEGGLKGNHYAATYFTALLLKEKRFEEAQPFISDITLMYSRFNFSQYDGIIEHYILPYCQMNQNAECIRVFSPFTKGKIE